MARNRGISFIVVQERVQERDLFTFYVMDANRKVLVYGEYFDNYDEAYYNAVDRIAECK